VWPNGTKQQTDAEDQFLKQIVVASSDVGTLVNFSDGIYVDVQNENNPEKLAAKLDRKGMGDTKIYDAVVSAVQWLARQAALPDCRKVIFLFTDGDDNTSRSSLDEATDALQRTGIPIFIVAPSSVEGKREGQKLSQLASQSGGRVYFLARDTKQVKFDFLKRDLAQSFLLRIAMPFSGGAEMVPVTINDVTDPRIHIVAPSRIVVPK
jgi:von Willebrand factor type A domain